MGSAKFYVGDIVFLPLVGDIVFTMVMVMGMTMVMTMVMVIDDGDGD
jgi:hypothetical protein